MTDIHMKTANTAPLSASKPRLINATTMTTFLSMSAIVLVQLVAAVAATDWALSLLLGLPSWASIALAVITAVPTVYGIWYVGKMAFDAETNPENHLD